MYPKISFEKLKYFANKAGLELLAVTGAEKLEQAAKSLSNWQNNGYAAGMKYMLRDADLQASPRRLLPEARSVISFAVAYSREARRELPRGHGKVARYAWGQDYHIVFPVLLEKLVQMLKAEVGDFKCRYFTDAVPLLERALAQKAGLGFVGKNTLLIKPRVGSMTLLAEIISDLEVYDSSLSLIQEGCGSCTRCLRNCPTQAFEQEYVLNAGKCISYLTIEKRSPLSIEERAWIGDWIFGCDVCQEVCPFNHSSLKNQLAPEISNLSAGMGAGQSLDLKKICEIQSKEEFSKLFQTSPILRIKREGLIRNAICVAVNSSYHELIDTLKILTTSEQSALIRQFAYWGFARLQNEFSGLSASDKIHLEKGLKDEAQVAEEVQGVLCLI